MNKKSKLTTVALAIMGMIGMVSAPALAAGTTQTVNQVEYFQGTLYIQLVNGTNYVGTTAAVSGCTAYNVTVDTIKIWQSLGQAALLSGHQVTLYYGSCGGNSYIQDVVLTAS